MNGDFTSITRMIRIGIRLALALAYVGVCGHNAAAQSRPQVQSSIHMPQGAFLRHPSPNVAALVQQVKSDPKVAIRYSRLFHLPVKMVPSAFQQLRLKTLTADHILQVHYVTTNQQNGEKLVYKPRRVKRGTPVYCMPDGTPLLVKVCGNPIRSRVSPELYSAAPVPDFNAGETLLPAPTGSSPIVHEAPSGSLIVPSTTLPEIPTVPAENVLALTELPPVPPALTITQIKTASLPPVYRWLHGGPRLVGLSPLALLSLVDFGSGSDASSSFIFKSPIQTPETPGNPPEVPIKPITPYGPINNVQITPEPGAITFTMTLLLSAGWLAARRRKI